MLLAVDIGNTNMKLAAFDGERIVASDRVPTKESTSPATAASMICESLAQHGIPRAGHQRHRFLLRGAPSETMLERAAGRTFGVT